MDIMEKELKIQTEEQVKEACRRFHQEAMKIVNQKRDELKTNVLENMIAVNQAMHYFKEVEGEVLKLGLKERSNGFILDYFMSDSIHNYVEKRLCDFKEEMEPCCELSLEEQIILKEKMNQITVMAEQGDYHYCSLRTILEGIRVLPKESEKEFNQVVDEIRKIILSAQQREIVQHLDFLTAIEKFLKEVLDFCYHPLPSFCECELTKEAQILGTCFEEILDYNNLVQILDLYEGFSLGCLKLHLEFTTTIPHEIVHIVEKLLEEISNISDSELSEHCIVDYV